MSGEFTGKGRVLFTFPVLYQGWECDEWGWVVEDEDGNRRLVMSSHGGEYIAKPSELEEKMAEYRTAIDRTQKALEIVATN